MSEQVRVRDVYEQYVRGQIPFDRVLSAAEEFLAHYARSRSGETTVQREETFAPQKPTAD